MSADMQSDPLSDFVGERLTELAHVSYSRGIEDGLVVAVSMLDHCRSLREAREALGVALDRHRTRAAGAGAATGPQDPT